MIKINMSKELIPIHYSKSGSQLTYEARDGGWLPQVTETEMFSSKDHANLPPSQGGCNLGGSFSIANINTDTGVGKVAYSWDCRTVLVKTVVL